MQSYRASMGEWCPGYVGLCVFCVKFYVAGRGLA